VQPERHDRHPVASADRPTELATRRRSRSVRRLALRMLITAAAGQLLGAMFWLRRKRFSRSYAVLTPTRRS
jgi:hypothetical protein